MPVVICVSSVSFAVTQKANVDCFSENVGREIKEEQTEMVITLSAKGDVWVNPSRTGSVDPRLQYGLQ